MDEEEDRRLRELENRLYASRPLPPPDFRQRLYRRLARRGFPAGRPPRLWWLAGGFGGAGGLLLAAALALV